MITNMTIVNRFTIINEIVAITNSMRELNAQTVKDDKPHSVNVEVTKGTSKHSLSKGAK